SYGCALLTGPPGVPLPSQTTLCVTNDAAVGDYTTGPDTTFFWDKSVVQGQVYYYRVTQLDANASQQILETPLAATDQVAGKELPYQEDRLPPPQGLRAWASATTGNERLGIQLRWCAIPTTVTDDNMPTVDEYRVYRARGDSLDYDRIARLDPSCLSV